MKLIPRYGGRLAPVPLEPAELIDVETEMPVLETLVYRLVGPFRFSLFDKI
jgi:hypothetical protein